MTFKSIGIDYQMGNYDKHLCESDSEKFRDMLTKDFKVSEIRIIRNQTNARPNSMQMKTNTRSI